MRKPSYTFSALLLILLLSVGISSLSAQGTKPRNKKDKKAPAAAGMNNQDVELASLYSDATTQKILGNYKEAMQLYMMCLRKYPAHPASNYEVASLFALSGQFEASLAHIQQAVKGDPTNKWFLALQSQILVELKKYKEAIKSFEQLVKLEPENFDHLLDLADVYIIQKDYKAAIEIYDNLEKQIGVTPEVSLQKQKLYEALGKLPLAIKEMEKLIEAFPDVPEYYGMFAELYMNHGKREEARKLYDKVMEMDPSNPVIHLALANYYQEAGETEKSFSYLKLAFGNPEVDIDDKIKILLSYYDISVNNNTRKKEAFELINVLLPAHPNEPKAYSIQGDFLLREGKYDEARQAFEKVLDFDNSKYPVWEQLMVLYMQLGQWEHLIEKSSEGIEVFPTQPVLYFYNGYGHYMLKDYQKAAEAFESGKDLVIDNENLLLQFYSSLGDCYYKLGRYGESDLAFEKALSISGTNTVVLNNYAYYLGERGVNLEKAKELASRVYRLEPKNPTFLDTYAWVLFKSGDLQQARDLIEQAIRLGGENNGEILEHYGDILYKSGDTEKALEQWQKAKNAGGELSKHIDEKIRDKKLFE